MQFIGRQCHQKLSVGSQILRIGYLVLRIFLQDCHSFPVVVMLATIWYCLFLISVIVRSLFVTSVVTLWTALQSKSIALTPSPPRVSLWRVKSSGVRQSKIYKWPLVVKGLICFQVVPCSVDQTTFQWTVHVRNLVTIYQCRSFCICVQGFKICKTLPPSPPKKNYMELVRWLFNWKIGQNTFEGSFIQ